VIGVKVGEDQQWNAIDAEAVEAPVHQSRIGPGIDDHGCSISEIHGEGVTLTDITGNHDPVGWRPSPRATQVRGDQRDADDSCERKVPLPPPVSSRAEPYDTAHRKHHHDAQQPT
jgi:hypothetical protein